MAKKTPKNPLTEEIKLRKAKGGSGETTGGKKAKVQKVDEVKTKRRKKKDDIPSITQQTRGRKKVDSLTSAHSEILNQLKKTVDKGNKKKAAPVKLPEVKLDVRKHDPEVTTSSGGSKGTKGTTGMKSRYGQMVARINEINDVEKLKKMIYNRNYIIKKKEYDWRRGEQVINDMRYVRTPTFRRLQKIKDKDKLVEALKKILISTTRRKNKPRVAADYSDREQEYMSKAVDSLKGAVSSWMDGDLKQRINAALDGLDINDMHEIFREVPSWWAISEGYYYAVTDFNDFMTAIYKLVESKSGEPLSTLDKKMLEDRFMGNDPRLYN